MKKLSGFFLLFCLGSSAFAAAVNPDLLMVAIKANLGALFVVGGACLLALVLKVAITRWLRRMLFKRGYLKIMPKQSSVVRVGKERFRRPAGGSAAPSFTDSAGRVHSFSLAKPVVNAPAAAAGRSKMDRVMRAPSGERVRNVLAAPGSYVDANGKVRVWGSAPSSRKRF